MNTWLLNRWDRLRNSLWFVPALALLIAFVAAIVLLRLDAAVRIETIPALQWATTTGPAARSILSVLAGALVTVAGVVFSITMLTLAQTSSMFGSRLLRSFLNHNATQCTLALFLATSLYCFTVLRTIREVNGGNLFVPHISVSMGLLAGLACLGAFVYFIHHVAWSIQAQAVVRNVAHELMEAIDRIFPEEPKDIENVEQCVPPEAEDDGQDAIRIEAAATGYIQAVDEETLMEVADDADVVIRLLRRPGDFIADGTPIAVVHPARSDEHLQRRISDCFLAGSRRTPRQDVVCAIYELVEVAVRALSPGVNDPHTALSCIDYLGAALTRLAQRPVPSSIRRDDQGRVRVITAPVTFGEALGAAVDEIRRYGCGSVSVMLRLADALSAVAARTTRSQDRQALLRQVTILERACDSSIAESCDQADVRTKLESVRDHLAGATVRSHGNRCPPADVRRSG